MVGCLFVCFRDIKGLNHVSSQDGTNWSEKNIKILILIILNYLLLLILNINIQLGFLLLLHIEPINIIS